jgi:hypothetical protein
MIEDLSFLLQRGIPRLLSLRHVFGCVLQKLLCAFIPPWKYATGVITCQVSCFRLVRFGFLGNFPTPIN